MKEKQYTLRRIPERTDRVLRERAATYGESLNETAIKALERGLNLSGAPLAHHDLDELAGTWVKDPAFDKAISAFDLVEPEVWK